VLFLRKETRQLASERNQAVAAALVVSLNLFRVAVDELALEHGMAQAADFVLDLEQLIAAFRIYNVFETELMIPDIFHDQVAALEEAVRSGEVRQVNRDVVAVVRRNLFRGLPEKEPLAAPAPYTRQRCAIV